MMQMIIIGCIIVIIAFFIYMYYIKLFIKKMRNTSKIIERYIDKINIKCLNDDSKRHLILLTIKQQLIVERNKLLSLKLGKNAYNPLKTVQKINEVILDLKILDKENAEMENDEFLERLNQIIKNIPEIF